MTAPEASDAAAYEAMLNRVTIGGARPLESRIEILEYDETWPLLYAREAERLREVLGDRIVRLEHVGSTAVPGLPAKPVIDLMLEVAASADEPAYLPDLEDAGYVLVVHEPEWFEHRLLKGPDTDIHLHVFSDGCEETERMLTFRDWLRASRADRDLYVRVKRELAARDWMFMQQYADAKSEVIAQIMARASSALLA